MKETDALVTIGGVDSSTVFVRIPAALATLEAASATEDELRYVLQRGVETAPPDSRWHVSIDGPALVGVVELQGETEAGKLATPTPEARHAVVETVKRELAQLGYDVNPLSYDV